MWLDRRLKRNDFQTSLSSFVYGSIIYVSLKGITIILSNSILSL